MRVLSIAVLALLLKLPGCPLTCEQELVIVEAAELHAVQVCAAGEGEACDAAKVDAITKRQAFKLAHPDGCTVPTPPTTLPAPPPTTLPGPPPTTLPAPPAGLLPGDQPQGREWVAVEPYVSDYLDAKVLGRGGVLRKLVESWGCETDDCPFPKIDGRKRNGPEALGLMIDALRREGLHAGRGNDDRSCYGMPWPAECGDDQVSVTEDNPADPATVWVNYQAANYGDPVKIRFNSRKDAWRQKGDPEPPQPSAACPAAAPPLPQLFAIGLHCEVKATFAHCNATPLVWSLDYCRAIGLATLPDGVTPRSSCPPWPEGDESHPECRVSRERLLFGGDGTPVWEELSGREHWQPENPQLHDYALGAHVKVCSRTQPPVCAEARP